MRHFESAVNGLQRTLMHATFIAALSFGANALADIQQGNQNGIAFENGGWSFETAEVIKSHAGKFPVLLVFAWNEGTYLSDVNVQVVNNKGTRVLGLNDLGPLVLIDLPRGAYTVHVERHGKSQSRRIDVAANTRTKAVFHWAKDAADRRAEVEAAGVEGPTSAAR